MVLWLQYLSQVELRQLLFLPPLCARAPCSAKPPPRRLRGAGGRRALRDPLLRVQRPLKYIQTDRQIHECVYTYLPWSRTDNADLYAIHDIPYDTPSRRAARARARAVAVRPTSASSRVGFAHRILVYVYVYVYMYM